LSPGSEEFHPDCSVALDILKPYLASVPVGVAGYGRCNKIECFHLATSRNPESPDANRALLDNPDGYTQRRLLSWIWHEYLKSYWLWIGFALILMSLEGSMLGLFSYMIAPLFDSLLESGDRSSVKWIGFTVGGIFFVRAFASFTHRVISVAVGQRIVAKVQSDMVVHLLAFSPSFFQVNAPGKLIERVRGDTTVIQGVWTTVIAAFFRDLIAVISLLAVAMSIDWLWTSVALLGAPLLVLPVLMLRNLIQRTARASRMAAATLTTRLDEIFHGITSIKLIRGEAFESIRFKGSLKDYVKATVTAQAGMAAVPSLMDLIAGIGFVGVMTYGGLQIVDGTKTVGDFMSFFTAIALLFEPVRRLGNVSGAWQAVYASLVRIYVVFDNRPDITSPKHPAKTDAETFKSKLTIDDVHLSFGAHRVLQGVSFEVAAGKTTALVGASGAGKTTLLNLLTRLVDADSGQILIGGIDNIQMDLAKLRDGFSVVSQEAWLFDESIEQNIMAGRPDATKGEFENALDVALVSDFANQFPDGVQTQVGPRGSNLSGGQKQRVAIARAVLRDAPILLLDEPTSALDSKSEAAVQKALEGLSAGRTTLVIAHRIATIRNADKIIVMDAGRVIEQGTHAQLIKSSNVYRGLYELQMGVEKSADQA